MFWNISELQFTLYFRGRWKPSSQRLSLLEMTMEAVRLDKEDYHQIMFISAHMRNTLFWVLYKASPARGWAVHLFLIKVTCKFIQPIRVSLRLQQRCHVGLNRAEPEHPH